MQAKAHRAVLPESICALQRRFILPQLAIISHRLGGKSWKGIHGR